jgi:hypothetical protein
MNFFRLTWIVRGKPAPDMRSLRKKGRRMGDATESLAVFTRINEDIIRRPRNAKENEADFTIAS